MAYGSQAQTPPPDSISLNLTLQQAEDRFLKNNLNLIAAHYNIDIANSQVITARLFQNPELDFANSLYNPNTKKLFDVSKGNSEYSASVSQLFLLAGKRNKSIGLAKIGVQQARYQFFDMLRTLKFTLRNDFYTLYFQQQSVNVYDDEINSLAKTLKVFKEQYAKGNIAQKEVLRIQSQLYSLQTELDGLQQGIDTVQAEFKQLLNVKPSVNVIPQYTFNLNGKEVLASVPYHVLLDSAYANRYDLKLTQSMLDYNNLNLKLQKAQAIPDVTFSLGFDKRGSYVENYNYAGISLPLPFFNRNQGGIKQAKIAIDQSKVQMQGQQYQVESDVATNYKTALRLEHLYNSFDPAFKDDFNHLIQEVFKNYEKRNISLLEFLDFYDSYKTNTIQLNNIQLNRVTSLEQLNYVTGTTFFNK